MIELDAQVMCPVCKGTGKTGAVFVYRPAHRTDRHTESIERLETCFCCSGAGQLSGVQLANWQAEQAGQVCPACGGERGKRHWSWREGEGTPQRQFLFDACPICGGRGRVSAEQVGRYQREQWRLRLGGVGCASVVLVVALVVVTQAVSLLIGQTPWFTCCPTPHLLLPALVIMAVR